MDKNVLRRLAGIDTVTEKKWSGSVEPHKHPPEDLFGAGSAAAIATWLKNTHVELKDAMSALNFYINRAGENLSAERIAELDSAKSELRKLFGVKEEGFDLAALRRAAGLPVAEKEDKEEESEEKEEESEEEKEEESEEEKEEESEEEKEEESEEEKEDKEEEMAALFKKIADEAEGKTGDELLDIIKSVYHTGVADGTATVAAVAEVKETAVTEGIVLSKQDLVGIAEFIFEKIKGTANLTQPNIKKLVQGYIPGISVDVEQLVTAMLKDRGLAESGPRHFGLCDLGNIGKVTVALAEAGLPVNLKPVAGNFFFHFTSTAEMNSAKNIAQPLIDRSKEWPFSK